jgi:hypothetical protein
MSESNGKLAVLMPSRGDPDLLRHAIDTAEATQSGQADFFVYIANDDPKLYDYHALSRLVPSWCHISFGPPLGFSRGVNELARTAMAYDEYEMLMRGEDDFEYQEMGWDLSYLRRARPDGVYMIWCNYVLKGPGAEPQTAAIGRKWYSALGWFSLPTVRHYFCDNVLMDLARYIDRFEYIPVPLIKHNWIPKPAYNEWGGDEQAYMEWRGFGLAQDAERLKQMILLGGST